MANAKYARALHETIPSYVSLLAWRLIENKVATKDNICKRGVFNQNMVHCVVGFGGEESVAHLFLSVRCLLVFGMQYASGSEFAWPCSMKGLSTLTNLPG